MKRDEMSAWLHDWDRALVRDAADRLPAEVKTAGSVLRPGAPQRVLRDAEARLGMKLPPELRVLLSLTDGAYADAGGPVEQNERRYHSTVPGLGLLPASDIVPVTAVEAERVAILVGISPGVGPVEVEGGAPVGLGPMADPRALLIGSSTEDSVGTVLVPVGRAWRLMHVTRNDVRVWSSIGSWLEAASYRPGVESVMQLVAWARAFDPRGQHLGDIRDPDAKPYLIAALAEFGDEPNVPYRLIEALSHIGGDDAVHAIRAWAKSRTNHQGQPRIVTRYLRTIGTPPALDALAELDAWGALAELRDVRGIRRGLQVLAEGHSAAFAHYAGLIRHPSFCSALNTALEVRGGDAASEHIRFQFGAALAKCGDARGIQLLRGIAADEESRWHLQATSILRRYESDGGPQV